MNNLINKCFKIIKSKLFVYQEDLNLEKLSFLICLLKVIKVYVKMVKNIKNSGKKK